MTESRRLRIGLVGCGRVAEERHLPALERLPEARVVALADTSPERLAKLGETYGVDRRYPDHHGLVADPEVEAVGVLTPTDSHAEIGMAALDAGKHLFMEKPLALSIEECDRLVAAAESAAGEAVLCFNLRWHRLVRRARAVVRSGRLGRIKGVRSVYTHYRPPGYSPDWHRKLELGGGVTFNESVHHFDLWRYLLGEEVTGVAALSRSLDDYDDETSAITVRFDSGALGTAFSSMRTGPNSELEVYGEEARLHLSLYRFDGLRIQPADRYPGSVAGRARESVRSLAQLPAALASLPAGDFAATFVGVWQHFLDCALRDQRPECTLADGRAAFRIAAAVVEAARSGEAVRLSGAVRG